jgi:hypothetical protein
MLVGECQGTEQQHSRGSTYVTQPPAWQKMQLLQQSASLAGTSELTVVWKLVLEPCIIHNVQQLWIRDLGVVCCVGHAAVRTDCTVRTSIHLNQALCVSVIGNADWCRNGL